MDNVTYRRNVLKTLSVRPAKAGLRWTLRSTNRVNLMHAVHGLHSEVSEFIVGLTPVLLGQQLSEEHKINAFEELGDIGYYLTVLAKCLKVKLPGSGKKLTIKTGTRAERILELLALSSAMLDLTKKTFYGPKMQKAVKVETTFEIEGDVSTKVETEVEYEVLDEEATQMLWAQRENVIAGLVAGFASAYWPLVYDMFGVPPANVFVGNIAKLEKRYGKGYFTLAEAEERDTESELEAMEGAASPQLAG